MNSPRPPFVADEPQPHRAPAVADGVGDEFADDEFGGAGRVLELPGGELPVDATAPLLASAPRGNSADGCA
ncbi:hypothetical protein ADL35_03745 [Streptomyces sp. NRRL WC-3753]|nr:hypothetical protein ADL35_03745 [Streptomyces sp. NRRL WC-3753]